MLLLPLLTVAVYALLVLIGLESWRSGRDPRAALAFAGAFALLLATGVLGLTDAPPYSPRELLVERMVVALAAPVPALLVLLQHHLGGWSRATARAVLVASLASAAFTLLGPADPIDAAEDGVWGYALIVVYAAVWIVCACIAVVGFLRLGAGRPGVVRHRMQTLAAAVVVLMLGVAAASALDADPDSPVMVACALVAGLLFGLGFRPPGWLREIWRREERSALRASFMRFLETTSERDALEAVMPPFVDLLGVEGVLMLGQDGRVLLERGVDAERATQLVGLATALPDGADVRGADDVIIVRGGSLVTIVVVASSTPLFGEEEVELVKAVSAFAELALERGRSMDTLRERDGQLRAAQEIAAMGSWEWEIDSDRVHVSPALREILGLPADRSTMAFADMIELVHPDDRGRVRELVEDAIAEGDPFLDDHRIVRGDGQLLHVHARGQLTRAGGRRRRRMTGIVQDITERKLGEEHLRTMFARERELTRRLTAIDTVKNNILAAVSHELRTPLTSVIGFALTLRDREELLEPGVRAEIVGHLAHEALRLQQLLGDLLDLDRLQRGVVEPRLGPTNLPELVDRVLEALPDRDAIHVEVEDVTVMLDGAKIDRVLANLLQNAIRHTPPGTRVALRGYVQGELLRIEVTDDGQGVPARHRERIFQPFDRGGAELDHAPGTGVGLAIVRQFVELHGGRSWVEDSPSGGAMFVVELPVAGTGGAT